MLASWYFPFLYGFTNNCLMQCYSWCFLKFLRIHPNILLKCCKKLPPYFFSIDMVYIILQKHVFFTSTNKKWMMFGQHIFNTFNSNPWQQNLKKVDMITLPLKKIVNCLHWNGLGLFGEGFSTSYSFIFTVSCKLSLGFNLLLLSLFIFL